MDRQELIGAVYHDLTDRSTWETRAENFYRMRHHGLRRKQKPFPGAADLHFPLSDTVIGRLRPAFFQQIFATDVLAQFVAMREQPPETTNAVGQWFDYQLKQNSNLEIEMPTAIDWELMLGRAVVKVTWDARRKQVRFNAIDPRQIIVPSWTVDLESADRIVHVQQYSKESFLRNPRFKASAEVVAQLEAPKDSEESGMNPGYAAKEDREGVTSNITSVTVWEVWVQEEDGKWTFDTFCPHVPTVDIAEKVENPYDHGKCPFIDFPYEIKDKGWYSPRGVVEQLAVHEAELCNLMNQKHDALTLTNRPLFRASRDIPNVATLVWSPGQIVPFEIEPVIFPAPPVPFNDAIQQVREVAEQRVTVPDFGVTRMTDTTQRRTATEVSQIANVFQQSSDLRMRIFRISLGRLYRMAWSLLKQYAKEDLQYWYVDQYEKLPDGALHDDYGILPSGSADGVNKVFLTQKAYQRLQAFRGDPTIDQVELNRSVLEIDDPTMVRRLVRDPGLKNAEEREEQAKECAVMHIGRPVMVSDADDHEAHLQEQLEYIVGMQQGAMEPHPQEIQLQIQHAQAHIEGLKKVDPKKAKMAQDAFAALFEQSQAMQPQDDVTAEI